jgi:hypothetical protein
VTEQEQSHENTAVPGLLRLSSSAVRVDWRDVSGLRETHIDKAATYGQS